MSRRSERRASLIVRNLPLDTRKDEVLDIFSEYGRVKDVYLPLNHYTRKFQGFGFVEFEDVRDADEAVRCLDGNSFGGRVITVQWSKEDRKTPREMMRREADDSSARRRDDRGYRDDRDRGYGGRDDRGYRDSYDRGPPRRRSRSPPPRRRDSPPPLRRRRDSPSPPRRSRSRDDRDDRDRRDDRDDEIGRDDKDYKRDRDDRDREASPTHRRSLDEDAPDRSSPPRSDRRAQDEDRKSE